MVTYTTLATEAAIERTVQALGTRTNVEAVVAQDRAQALEMLVGQIPEGVEIYPGSSTTLEEIGYMDYLGRNPTRYRNLRDGIANEPDLIKRAELRRRTGLADYYIGSVHAVAETGELVIASRTGSQIPANVYTARHVVWVIGAQKIVATLERAFARVREHSLPLEDARIRSTGDAEGSFIGKLLIVEHERQAGRMLAILVKEHLGF